MTDIIERVARAIYEADPEGGYYGGEGMPWRDSDIRKEVWDDWLGIARAAIQAMREPTNLMLYRGEGMTDFVLPYAGVDDTGNTSTSHADRLREMRVGYQTMIDAALESE